MRFRLDEGGCNVNHPITLNKAIIMIMCHFSHWLVGLGVSSYFTRWAGGKVKVWDVMKMELKNR